MLTKTKVADHIWAVYSDSQVEIGKAFIRFQEFYENKDLKGIKSITVKQIERWWKAECSNISGTRELYYTFWVGFNIPGKVILNLLASSEFRQGFSVKQFLRGPLNYPRWHREEDQLIDLLQDLSVEEIATGYFIGVAKDSKHVLDHEVAHGFYATNAAYKSAQLHNIANLPKDIYGKIRDDLISMSYHADVIHDEIQAYLSTYVETLGDTFETDAYTQYTGPFVDVFRKFYYQDPVV